MVHFGTSYIDQHGSCNDYVGCSTVAAAELYYKDKFGAGIVSCSKEDSFDIIYLVHGRGKHRILSYNVL